MIHKVISDSYAKITRKKSKEEEKKEELESENIHFEEQKTNLDMAYQRNQIESLEKKIKENKKIINDSRIKDRTKIAYAKRSIINIENKAVKLKQIFNLTYKENINGKKIIIRNKKQPTSLSENKKNNSYKQKFAWKQIITASIMSTIMAVGSTYFLTKRFEKNKEKNILKSEYSLVLNELKSLKQEIKKINFETKSKQDRKLEEIVKIDFEKKEKKINPKNKIIFNEKKYSTIDKTKIIAIPMYHGIGKKKYDVKPNDFKKQLLKFYKEGFYFINLNEFITADYSRVPQGKKPILLTFDDSLKSQCYGKIVDNKFVPSKKSAVGMLEEFFNTIPSAGKGAVFFANKNLFDENNKKEKLAYLIKNGFDIEYHTTNHEYVSKMTISKFNKDLDSFNALVSKYLPGYKARAIAFPGGADPNKEVQEIINQRLQASFDAEYDQPIRGTLHDIGRVEMSNRKISKNNLTTYFIKKNYFQKPRSQLAMK